MNKEPLPALPFRPLGKIVARGPDIAPTSDLQLGDKVNILIPNGYEGKPFWRIYEVTLIDGDHCRLVTPDKRFKLTDKVQSVKALRDVQRQLKQKG